MPPRRPGSSRGHRADTRFLRSVFSKSRCSLRTPHCKRATPAVRSAELPARYTKEKLVSVHFYSCPRSGSRLGWMHGKTTSTDGGWLGLSRPQPWQQPRPRLLPRCRLPPIPPGLGPDQGALSLSTLRLLPDGQPFPSGPGARRRTVHQPDLAVADRGPYLALPQGLGDIRPCLARPL